MWQAVFSMPCNLTYAPLTKPSGGKYEDYSHLIYEETEAQRG